MKMKELESRTGVNRESIRYYIREGLLPQPKKLKRNVAIYGPEHIDRMQLIKRLQDEHFLPLKVVKDVLEKITDETSFSNLSRPALSALLPTLIQDTADRKPTTLAKLVATTGLEQSEIEQMAEAGAIRISASGNVPARDAEIVRLWASVREAGFSQERGYDIDYLLKYVAIAKQWATLETELFLDAFADTPDNEAAAAGAKGLEISSSLVSLMRTNTVLQIIDGQPDGETSA